MFSCLLGLVKIHHAETFVKNALPTHTLASLRRLVHRSRSEAGMGVCIGEFHRTRLLDLDDG
jgi:hypothetical protein